MAPPFARHERIDDAMGDENHRSVSRGKLEKASRRSPRASSRLGEELAVWMPTGVPEGPPAGLGHAPVPYKGD